MESEDIIPMLIFQMNDWTKTKVKLKMQKISPMEKVILWVFMNFIFRLCFPIPTQKESRMGGDWRTENYLNTNEYSVEYIIFLFLILILSKNFFKCFIFSDPQKRAQQGEGNVR